MAIEIDYSRTSGLKVDKILEQALDFNSYIDWEKSQSKIQNSLIRNWVYSFLPDLSQVGRFNPNLKNIVYFDSTYSVGDSDGTISKPYNTLLFRDMVSDNTVYALKRGSNFFVASEREAVCYIQGNNCTLIAYGDESKPLPIVWGVRSFPGAEFTADGSEFSRTITRSQSHTFDYVAFEDDPLNPLVQGTAVGALTSGQYIYSGGKLYVKDNPTSSRNVLISMTRRVFAITGSNTVIDQVYWGGSSNHGLQVSFDVASTNTAPILRDTASFFCGNNGIEVGENAKKANQMWSIRHVDIGSRNNGINGSGDDGFAYFIEPSALGVLRKAGETYGYSNDGITAHGAEGVGKWVVVGGTVTNVKEDGIDIIGVTGGGVLHADSVIAFNTINTTGESGVFAWGLNPQVFGNRITNTQWAPVQVGPTTASNVVINGLVMSNWLDEGGKAANSAGVSLGGKGTTVRRNTMIRRASSVRALMQFANIAILESATIESNLFITESDSALINTNTSSGAVIKTLTWRDNHYVIPSGNVTLPFATGGTPKTFAQWKTDVEGTATSSATLAAGGIGADYRVEITSLLNRNGRTPPFVDFDGRIKSGAVGALFR